jgi:hypothetical protein
MLKTLIYYPPEYRDLAHKIRENYIEHHHGEVDLISETDQNDIEYARKMQYDEAIFIEDSDTVIIHNIKTWFTEKLAISDVYYKD